MRVALEPGHVVIFRNQLFQLIRIASLKAVYRLALIGALSVGEHRRGY